MLNMLLWVLMAIKTIFIHTIKVRKKNTKERVGPDRGSNPHLKLNEKVNSTTGND